MFVKRSKKKEVLSKRTSFLLIFCFFCRFFWRWAVSKPIDNTSGEESCQFGIEHISHAPDMEQQIDACRGQNNFDDEEAKAFPHWNVAAAIADFARLQLGATDERV